MEKLMDEEAHQSVSLFIDMDFLAIKKSSSSKEAVTTVIKSLCRRRYPNKEDKETVAVLCIFVRGATEPV
jgi:hypothetical protein